MLCVVIDSGSSASSAFQIERAGALPLVVMVPSASANGWQLAFSTSSAGPWLPSVNRTSGLTTVFSGSAGASVVVDYPPTPFARIQTTAALSDVASVAIAVTRRLQ